MDRFLNWVGRKLQGEYDYDRDHDSYRRSQVATMQCQFCHKFAQLQLNACGKAFISGGFFHSRCKELEAKRGNVLSYSDKELAEIQSLNHKEYTKIIQEKTDLEMKIQEIAKERARQENEEKRLIIQRNIEAEMNKVKVEEERIRVEADKQLKAVELENKKRLAEMREEHERNEKEQALKHKEEMHRLKMEMDKKEQEHKHEIKRRKLDIDAEFSERAAMNFSVPCSNGETVRVAMTNGIDPQFAALIFDRMTGAGRGDGAIEALGGKKEAITEGSKDDEATGQNIPQ